MPKSWVIVQSAEDVERSLVSDEVSHAGPHSFLATTADAYFALRRHHLPGRSTHEFVSKDDLDQIALDNYEKVRGVILRLDQLLRCHIPELPAGFRPFEALEFQTKHLADSIAFTVKELAEFCKAESPEELLYWSNERSDSSIRPEEHALQLEAMGSSSLRTTGDTIASLVLSIHEWWERLGISTKRLATEVPVMKARGQSSWRRWIRRLINPNRLQAINALPPRTIFSLPRSKGKRLLIIGKADNIPPFINYAQSEHRTLIDWWTHFSYDPVRLPSLRQIPLDGSTEGITNVIAQGLQLPQALERRTLWEYWGDEQPVPEILWKRLTAFWRFKVPYLLSLHTKAIEYCEGYHPFAVISGTNSSVGAQVIGQAARDRGIPVVSFQHGGGHGYVHSPWLKLSDLRADIYAAYGPEGSRHLENVASGHGLTTKTVSIGWSKGSRLEKHTLSSGTKEKNDVNLPATSETTGYKVMYAPTGLKGDTRYGPYHDIHDTEYCLEQVKVILTLAKLPDINVLVKLHYKGAMANPLEQWIQDQRNPRIRALRGEKFAALLPLTDLVLLDVPPTTLIEAMAAARQVVYLHSGYFHLTAAGEALMRETATWVDKAPGWEVALSHAVVQALQAPAPEPKTNPFLAAYASLDFHPERLWETLEDVRQCSRVDQSIG